MKYFVIINKEGNNFGAYSPDVLGCVATGNSISEVSQRMREALVCHLEEEDPMPMAKGLEYWMGRLDEIAEPGSILIEMSIESELSTRDAFKEVLKERGVSKKLGVDRSTVANWKRYLEKGENISSEKMEQVLKKAGWRVMSQQSWKLPSR